MVMLVKVGSGRRCSPHTTIISALCGHGVNNERNAALHTSLCDRMPTPPEDIGGAFS